MNAGRWIITLGLLVVAVGVFVWLAGRLGFRGMPGDISYKSESGNVRFYFPLGTSILLSVLLTLGILIWNWWSRR